MIYTAYELNAYLKYLTLDADINCEIEFIGKDEDFKLVDKEIQNYEFRD